MQECFTCRVSATPTLHVYADEHIVVNHYQPSLDESERPGWFIVSPRRHITRWWELTDTERHRIADVTAIIDRTLTERYGSLRTMVASLGWQLDDHVHVHCVPITADATHRGHQIFQGDYIPLNVSANELPQQSLAYSMHFPATRH